MLKVEFEGTDGAGKNTAITYFIEQAKARHLNVVETREVGNPHIPVCLKLRELVLDPNSGLTGAAMECVFAAMRYQNDVWFNKLLHESPVDLVVSDRGLFSHLAYTDHNVNPSFTRDFYEGSIVPTTQMPDVVIFFKVDTETALKRRTKRGGKADAIELKGIEFQEKVRESFEKYIDKYIDEGMISWYFKVDANQDIKGVQRQLDDILEMLCNSAGLGKISGAW